MSGWLRRLSTTYRMAVAAEAAGDYLEAAKAYALCEERHKVAEMHILEAARRAVPGSAAAELLIAANFLHDDESAPQALLRRLGEALLRLVRSRDLIDSDRELATVAAQVLRRAGEPLLAAEAYQRVGDVDRAVELLSLAGEVERVEQLLSGHQSEREQAERERELTASYESAQRLGRRDEALSLLRQLVSVAKDKREPQRLCDDLSRRMLNNGQIELRLSSSVDGGAEDRVLCALPPLLWGRGEECGVVLGDPGVSRQHVRLQFDEQLGFSLVDLDSKNGTFLDGMQVGQGARLPLRQVGELGLGLHVRAQFTVEHNELSLKLRTGMRRGLRVRLATKELIVAGPLRLRFSDGKPLLFCDEEGLRLNGQRVASGVQLVVGDVVEAQAFRCEVLSR